MWIEQYITLNDEDRLKPTIEANVYEYEVSYRVSCPCITEDSSCQSRACHGMRHGGPSNLW